MPKDLVLAVESSCDDTALALLDCDLNVLAESKFSQIELHNRFGGVVPELASRAHFERIEILFKDLREQHPFDGNSLKHVAATCGPGLIGPLLVGASFAKGLAKAWDVPFVGTHHLRGHLASLFLASNPTLSSTKTNIPKASDLSEERGTLVLLVSGGHTQVLSLAPGLKAEVLATTADDSAGECFDKSAKLMGLPYPGGPAIEKLASQLNSSDRPQAEKLSSSLPRPKSQAGFSFSGLKTAIRLKLESDPTLRSSPAFAWAIQETIGDALVLGLKRVMKKTPSSRIAFCGGVSANKSIREKFQVFCDSKRVELFLAPIRYSTDNAAMIAAASILQRDDFVLDDVKARPPL